MKKTIFLSLAMAFVTIASFAQEKTSGAPKGRPTVEERAKRQTDRINATATLTPDQYNKVLEIVKNFVGQREAVRAAGQSEENKAKFKALGKEEEEQIKKVLTPAQFEKVQAAKKAQQEGGEGHKAE